MQSKGPFLVADSGSTKTDWVFIRDGAIRARFNTVGFNPQFHDAAFILDALNRNRGLKKLAGEVTNVYFFGAGCSSAARNKIIRDPLKKFFSSAVVKVDHDVLASVLATCGSEPGISCILGTGSNSCYYDGKKTYPNNFGLGYIIGDEGSGSYYGKRLIRDYLYGILPSSLVKKFERQYTMSKEIMIRNVYNNKGANVWLASFSRFLSDNKSHPWVIACVTKGMGEFMDCCVRPYPNHRKLTVHFTGSVAYYFSGILRKVAKEKGIRVGKIIKQPIEELAGYFTGR